MDATDGSWPARTGLLNGTRGRLEQIDTRRQVFVLRTEHDGGVVGVPFRYSDDGNLTHGYATTIHKAQGATVDLCRSLVGDAMNREQLYTALSRGRAYNHLYVDDAGRRGLDRHVQELTPTADQRLQSAVARSGAQQMAVDQASDGLVPISVLRAERDRLQHALAGRPYDPTPDVKRLADERRDVQRRLARAGQERARVQDELDEIPLITRLRHRERRVVLEHYLNHLDREIEAQTGRLHQVRRQRDDLAPRRKDGEPGTQSTSPTPTGSPPSDSASAWPRTCDLRTLRPSTRPRRRSKSSQSPAASTCPAV